MEQCEKTDSIISGKLDLVENLGEYALVHLTSNTGMEFIAKLNNSPKEKKGENGQSIITKAKTSM